MLNNSKFHYRQCGRARVPKKNMRLWPDINGVLRGGRGSVAGIATTLQNTAVRIPAGEGDFIVFITSRQALGPSKPSIYRALVGGGTFLGIKWPECDDHSLSSRAAPETQRAISLHTTDHQMTGGALLVGAKDCPTCTCRLKTSTIPTSMQRASALCECFQFG